MPMPMRNSEGRPTAKRGTSAKASDPAKATAKAAAITAFSR